MENKAKENKKHSTQPNVQKGNTENSNYNSDIKQNIKKFYSSLEIKIVQCNICYEAWPLYKEILFIFRNENSSGQYLL